MASFADIANKKIEDVERPPLAPQGHYVFTISKPAAVGRIVESAKGRWEVVEFFATGSQAMDDVDPEDLEKFGGADRVRMTVSFMFPTEEEKQADFQTTEFRFRQFLEHMGMASDISLGQATGECTGHSFVGKVEHRPDPNNAEIFYAEIRKTMPIT